MILQKHYTRKDKSQWKYEIVIPKKEIKKAGFKEGEELEINSNKGVVKILKR